ncbi:MAG: hypothetical protein KF775_00150 [Cyclobacteriaceae bacterium]|nr:hypothetical protein [Cyclobacteriaceae bacterium]
MDTLIVQPENEAQLAAIKAFLKALKVSYKKSEYDPAFVKKINASKANFKKGRFKTIRTSDLWK